MPIQPSPRAERHAGARPRSHRRPGSAATAAGRTSARTPHPRSRRTRRGRSTVGVGPEPLADLDRLVEPRSSRACGSRARPRPIPPRASSRRSRTRGVRRTRCRGSARRAPRRTGGAARCCRRGSRAGCVRSGLRGTNRYANAVEDRHVGRDRWVRLAGCGDRLIRDVKIRCSGSHTDSNPSRSASSVQSTKNAGLSARGRCRTSCQVRDVAAVEARIHHRRRGCRRRRAASSRSRSGRGRREVEAAAAMSSTSPCTGSGVPIVWPFIIRYPASG